MQDSIGPSRHQIRCTRLALTRQSLGPQQFDDSAITIPTILAGQLADGRAQNRFFIPRHPGLGWVERSWPITRQARHSEMRNCGCKCAIRRRRRRSFPQTVSSTICLSSVSPPRPLSSSAWFPFPRVLDPRIRSSLRPPLRM